MKVVAGGKAQYNHVTTAVGYLGSSEKIVHFGLGSVLEAELVEIAWPAGGKTVLRNVKTDRTLKITE